MSRDTESSGSVSKAYQHKAKVTFTKESYTTLNTYQVTIIWNSFEVIFCCLTLGKVA